MKFLDTQYPEIVMDLDRTLSNWKKKMQPSRDMEQLDVRDHDVCPKWNYTIHPRRYS